MSDPSCKVGTWLARLRAAGHEVEALETALADCDLSVDKLSMEEAAEDQRCSQNQDMTDHGLFTDYNSFADSGLFCRSRSIWQP